MADYWMGNMYAEMLEGERVAALVLANDAKGKLAFDGDGNPYNDEPIYCPPCDIAAPFDLAHECEWTAERITCKTTGHSITRAEWQARRVNTDKPMCQDDYEYATGTGIYAKAEA